MLIVDAANVVGSVPDGWWRDRLGAARRLRDGLVRVAAEGLPGLPGPQDVVLVVEGRARDVDGADGVRIVRAAGSGDDAIVALVRAAMPRPGPTPDGTPDPPDGVEPVVVVTADRGLRDRVRALGARVIGPRALPYGPGRYGSEPGG